MNDPVLWKLRHEVRGYELPTPEAVVAHLPPVPQLGSGDGVALKYIARADDAGFKAHKTCLQFPPTNLAVWKMTDEPGDITPTVQWRAASGRIIRTIPNQGL